jgi:hypothetical protein
MTNEELTQLLADFEKKLAFVAAQARVATQQSRKAEALVKALREEVSRLKRKVIASTETQEFEVPDASKKPQKK